jgi:hypothetical protein
MPNNLSRLLPFLGGSAGGDRHLVRSNTRCLIRMTRSASPRPLVEDEIEPRRLPAVGVLDLQL